MVNWLFGSVRFDLSSPRGAKVQNGSFLVANRVPRLSGGCGAQSQLSNAHIIVSKLVRTSILISFYGGVLDLFGLEVSGGNLLRAELPKDTWESAQNGAQNDEISVLFLIVYRVALARRFLTETCPYLFWERPMLAS